VQCGGVIYFTTLPPAAVHSLAEAFVFQPWPLQLFWPLHSLVAVLQSDVPLQLLTPEHFTDMSLAAWAVVTVAPMANKAAAALAIAIADLKLEDIVFPLAVEQNRVVGLQTALDAQGAWASAYPYESGQCAKTYKDFWFFMHFFILLSIS
jgi:hypothetical protein